jgi:hypothetical protein
MLLVKCRDANRKDLATNYLTLERIFACKFAEREFFQPINLYVAMHCQPMKMLSVHIFPGHERQPVR